MGDGKWGGGERPRKKVEGCKISQRNLVVYVRFPVLLQLLNGDNDGLNAGMHFGFEEKRARDIC
jgi:hypothetical protein